MGANINQFLKNPIPVWNADDVTVYLATVSVSTTSVELAPANPDRVRLTIRNRSGSGVFINVDDPATLNDWEVEDGEDAILGGGQKITAIRASGTGDIKVSWEVRNG